MVADSHLYDCVLNIISAIQQQFECTGKCN